MAVYHDIPGADLTFKADVDLDGVQYYFVRASSTAGNVQVANGASNPTPVGILQNAPKAGQEARVRVLGPTKVFAVTDSSNALAYGRYATVNASGQAAGVASETGVAVGRWLSVAAPVSASRFGELFFFGFSACVAAAS